MKQQNGNSRVRAIRQRVCVIAVVLAVGALLWILQSPQEAQVALRTAQPSVSAHLGSAPEQVRLGFDQAPASDARAKVMVLSPEDENLALGPATTSLDGVSQRVAALEEQGAYQVSYEVALADGSVSRGQYWFWYAPSSSGPLGGLSAPALSGLALVALAAALRTVAKRRKTLALVPARRTPVTTSPVPAQRSRQNHEGLSPPGSRPRPSPAPELRPAPHEADSPRHD